jgi:hypothetical protein
MRAPLVASLVVLMACGDSASTGGGGSGETAGGPPCGECTGGTGTGGTGVGGSGQGGGDGGMAATVSCDPLPPPAGAVIDVDPSMAASLPQLVFDAAPGTTFSLADGTYVLSATLQVRAPGLTLRSASDDAEAVVLSGDYAVNELVQVTASDATLAHLTLTRAVDHLVHVVPPGPGQDVLGFRLYGARMIDSGEQFLKVNPISGQQGYIDEGRVECSTFAMTEEGRANVEPCCGGCYTGGIDVHAGWGWVVANNRFEGIYCDGAGLAEHAIHFWKGSRDTLVERNVIVDCARGVGFGLGSGAGERVYPDAPHGGAFLAHYDGVIRGNVIFATNPFFDTGIEIAEANEPHVHHNTVIATASATAAFSSIDYRFAQTSVIVKNNLVNNITQRDGASGEVSNNLESTPLEYFVDVGGADLHLVDGATGALGQGVPLGDAGLDIDGEPRDGSSPDLGADER